MVTGKPKGRFDLGNVGHKKHARLGYERKKKETTIVLKRSMASGYAGVGNPLFVLENTRMLFGDANATMQAVLKALKG